MRIAALAWVAVALACAATGAACADEAKGPDKPMRLALVIGNGAYKDAPLSNPVNDAADMAKALEASGFTVIQRQNATLKEMHLALREFGDKLGRTSTGLFYFAGHGMQVRGHNYLLPVDADIAREDEVAFAALDLGAVMDKLDSAKNPVNIVILDACRNNPFGTRLATSAKGLAQVDAPPGTLIAFSTAPGSTAADGKGRNGLYTENLVQQIARQGAPIEEVFKATRAAVRTESRSLQVPWESTSLETAFVFRAAPVAVAAAPGAPMRVAVARPASAPRSAPAPVGAPPAFAAGDTWTYRVTNLLDNTERKIVLKVTSVHGDEIVYGQGQVKGDLVGNYTHIVRQGRTDDFKPSNYFYVFPLRNGGTWTLKAFQKTGERGFDLEVKLKVGAEEEVDTPMGKLRGIRIERQSAWKQRNGKSGGVNTWTYWYNSAVKRFVAAEQANVTTDGKTLARERYDLVAYDVK
ncbi:MAG TPA: caspase family protein [Usitatibacter sp.]|nr:caspase family protein [Usitatibacter sp.]